MNFRLTGGLFLAAAGMLVCVTSVAAPPSAPCRVRGEAALQAFTHGEFGKVGEHFAPAIAAKATADTLHGAWNQLETTYGAFKQVGALAPRKLNGQNVLVAPITFAKGALDAVVACDAGSRIVAFQFVPPSLVAAASSDAEASAANAMTELLAVTKTHERAPDKAVTAHVDANGVCVLPLDVQSPFGPLHGALTLPAGKGPFPAVVLVQGSGSSDMDESIGPNKPFRDIADGLAMDGIATLRYDKRDFAYPMKVAANAKLTVDDEVTNDALTALQLLAKQPSINPRRVFVLGHSEGAMLVPRVVARDPKLAGGIMLAAPARPLLAVSAEQVRELGAKSQAPKAQVEANLKAIADEQALLDHADPKHAPTGHFGPAPQTWWLSLHDYHQVEVAKALSRPLLILQGGSDWRCRRARTSMRGSKRWRASAA